MTGVHTVQHSLNQLLLPIADYNFVRAWQLAQHELEKKYPDSEEARGDYLTYEIEQWHDTGQPSPFLRKFVATCLTVEEILGETFPKKFFKVHQQLRLNGQLSFQNASSLLSHANMIAKLLAEERLSCAQVASVLSARRSGFAYNWHQLQIVARGLSRTPELDSERVYALMDRDVESTGDKFADASPVECIDTLVDVGTRLGYPGDLANTLTDFYPSNQGFQPAYSVILHTNLLVVEEYDHPASAAYEFSPRSEMALKIQQDKHPSYTKTASAYLNNSKGVFAFDRNWAWARDATHRRQALGLADLLDCLSQMAYPARRELASWIRPWLMRIESVFVEGRVSVGTPTLPQIDKFIQQVSAGNTRSYGILEQRTVDFLAAAIVKSTLSDYEVRGLGDSVSASNTSKRKLGDVEFKDRKAHSIHAFEAHGGDLVPLYVDMHRASFSRILPKRRVELEQLADPGDWQIVVHFVAHGLTGVSGSPVVETVDEYNVEWNFHTYSDLWDKVKNQCTNSTISQLFEDLVTRHIRGRWVTDEVKARFNAYAEI